MSEDLFLWFVAAVFVAAVAFSVWRIRIELAANREFQKQHDENHWD